MPQHLEIVGNGFPKSGALLDAPVVQCCVIIELQVVAQVDPAAKGIHSAGLDLRRSRTPKHIIHAIPPIAMTRLIASLPAIKHRYASIYSTLACCTSCDADHTR
ncbi:hypothetical protein D3C73_1448090 [compost metagenome]